MSKEQPMSDTLQEQEDATLTTIRNSDDAQRKQVQESDWCDDCHGYVHAPWCPHYSESSKEVSDQTPTTMHQPAARGGGDGPERIWLQPGQALDPAECTLSHVGTERVTERDIEYVHIDQHQALVAERELLVEALKGVAIMLNTEFEKYDKEPWAQRVRVAIAASEQRSTSDG